MKTFVHSFTDPQGDRVEITLVEDEKFASAALNKLTPLAVVDPDHVLLEMAGLGSRRGVALDQVLGQTGPLVASRAGAENTRNPTAGLFDAMFGRDSEIIAMFLEFQLLRETTSMYWAEREGRCENPLTGEEPGARMHEFRNHDDLQRTALELGGMHFPDFGSTDAEPLWCLNTLACIEANPGFLDRELIHYLDGDSFSIGDAFGRTLSLLSRWEAKNPEGIIEAQATAGVYKSFPFWKDSPDAYHHKDGTLASPPVSTVEMMAYLYDTYAGAARLARARPTLGWDAEALDARAAATRERLIKHYWVPASPDSVDPASARGFFALGTDRHPTTGQLRKLEVRTSNMGYLLDSGILDGEEMRQYREAIAEHLFSPEMLCPAGTRTLASDEVRFSENAYHNGTVWPQDVYKIACGLRRYYPELALVLMNCVKRDCKQFMPEFVPGNSDPEPKPNELVVRVQSVNVYGEVITRGKAKSPQPIQGWTAAARKAIELCLRGVIREAQFMRRSQSPEALFAARIAKEAHATTLREVTFLSA